ncbi:helix-turn-helix transcriptional regulator [Lentzea sp. NPDC042327]|uniref:helix-turn-helix domain-containing protein n=1 Tax=Lentzea sp. NPDC042327 TaxID=3154801 RepID=UPI0034052BAF
MAGDVPNWARRIRALRQARGWSEAEAAAEMRRHTDEPLASAHHLVRHWQAWERGENKPSSHYAPIIAAALHTVTASLFPPDNRTRSALEISNATGMDTLELVTRLRTSSIDNATLEALRFTVDQLCSEYAHSRPDELLREGRRWLRRVVEVRHSSSSRWRDALELAGWLALLVGCLEHDMDDRGSAEASRRTALSLGAEAGSAGVLGWAHEMRAWFALTAGDYSGAVVAARSGQDVAGPRHSVAVQLIAQEAKAWARMGERAEMERALDRGRLLLESMPYPDNLENHFVVDPDKFDFYVMDCYRHVGDDRLASGIADEVIRVSTGPGGFERAPMRIAEARVTLGVAAARAGDLEGAIAFGRRALGGDRKSLPSLKMVSRDLAVVLGNRFGGEPAVRSYLDELRSI